MLSLLICSVTMSGLALVYMAVTPLLAKRYAGKWRYYAWLAIVIGLIIPFRPHFNNVLIHLEPSGQTILPTIRTANGLLIFSPDGGPVFSAASENIPWWQIIFMLWLTGAALFIAYRVIQHCRFVKLAARWSDVIPDKGTNTLFRELKLEMGIQKHVGLYRCSCVSTPMLTGLAAPRILLPDSDFAADELRFILKHELAHYTRKDLWCKCLVLLATAIHWFNPVAYLVAKAIGAECETSCDAAVMKSADMDTRQYYCETIIGAIKYGSKPVTVFSTNFYSGKTCMKKRVSSIMDATAKRSGRLIVCVVGICTILLGCTVLIKAPSATHLNSVSAAGWRTTPGGDVQEAPYMTPQGMSLPEYLHSLDLLTNDAESGLLATVYRHDGKFVKAVYDPCIWNGNNYSQYVENVDVNGVYGESAAVRVIRDMQTNEITGLIEMSDTEVSVIRDNLTDSESK
jgi:beta-lactamase regulating signal transducer with metallopeptidase domain